jgi:hypothetical protein
MKRATWKSLLENLYLVSATRDLKGEEEAYTFNYRNNLGGIMMLASFFDPETKSFAQDPCFIVIMLPSIGSDGPTLTLTSDEVWGDENLLRLLGLPVTDTGDNPMSPVCGTVGSKCISGLYRTPIREEILRMPLVWCMNGDVVLSVGSVPQKMAVDNKITGWLGVNDLKETEYHSEILFPAFTDEAASTSVFDLLPMVLPLPFNHGLPVGYAISGKITGEKMIEAWNVFAGAGGNSHQWIDTPLFHGWGEVARSGEKMAL